MYQAIHEIILKFIYYNYNQQSRNKNLNKIIKTINNSIKQVCDYNIK